MGVFKRGRFYWYSFNYRNVRVQKSTRQGDREEAKKKAEAAKAAKEAEAKREGGS